MPSIDRIPIDTVYKAMTITTLDTPDISVLKVKILRLKRL